MKTIFSLF